MSIENISNNNLTRIQEEVNINILKKSMDFQKNSATQLIDSLKEFGIGNNIDILA